MARQPIQEEKRLTNGKMLFLVVLCLCTVVLPAVTALYGVETLFKRKLYDLKWLHLLYVTVLAVVLLFVANMIPFYLGWLLYLMAVPVVWIYKERAFKQVYKPLKKLKPILSNITYRQRGNKRIVYGGLAVLVGLAVTLITLDIALTGEFGGWYFVWFGPVLFGGYELLRGIADILHPKGEYIPISQPQQHIRNH